MVNLQSLSRATRLLSSFGCGRVAVTLRGGVTSARTASCVNPTGAGMAAAPRDVLRSSWKRDGDTS